MEIIRIEIPEFVRQVKMSEKQKAQYFEWTGIFIKGKGRKIPIKYFRNKIEIDKPCLEDLVENQFVIGLLKTNKIIKVFGTTETIKEEQGCKLVLCKARNTKYLPIITNPKRVGKPRYYLINGQDIYNGKLNHHSRGFIMDKIKECYLPYVKDISPINEYPIRIDVEIHDTIKNFYDRSKEGLGQRWDVDNYAFPYMKAFPDLLYKLGKIKDDDRLHITQPPIPRFVPIDNHKKRKLVFILYKDERPEITNNKTYQEYHKNKETFETEDIDLIKDDELLNFN